MGVRSLLLFVVFFGICLFKQSSSSPVLTLQRAHSTLDATLKELVPQRSSHGSYSLVVEEENGRSEGLTTVHGSESIGTGVSLLARRLLLGERKFLSRKVQYDKEQQTGKRDNKHDTVSEKGSSSDAKLPNHPSTDNKGKLGDEETHPTDMKQSAPPPSFKPGDTTPSTSTEGNKTEAKNPMPNVKKSDEQIKDDSTPPETKPKAPAIQCGESHCEDPKKLVSACLRIPGDGAHKLSLFITNEGDSEVSVKVIAPEYLIADLLEVLVSKGKSGTIHFMMDTKYEPSMLEGMKNKKIIATTVNGDCEIAVPIEYLRNSVHVQKSQLSSYLHLVTPRVVAYFVVFVLIVALVGAWWCYKCRAKKRAGDAVKYQQLEMIAPGQSTPKERAEGRMDPWDEVWDEDWEDAEAAKSSARLSQNLSSRGLAARRGNKDGWDTSWED